MKAISVVLAVLFMATLLASAPPKYYDPPSPCLMFPKTTHGQGSGVKEGPVPKTCVT